MQARNTHSMITDIKRIPRTLLVKIRKFLNETLITSQRISYKYPRSYLVKLRKYL